ncbi:MAG UNVERIFIED_CONTAM: hypothetical protein LVT10_26205 [Anaerolineae bacterium]
MAVGGGVGVAVGGGNISADGEGLGTLATPIIGVAVGEALREAVGSNSIHP